MNESVETAREYADAYADYIHCIVREHSAITSIAGSRDMAGRTEHEKHNVIR